MFEDALVMERSAGGSKRWIVMGSLAVQACMVAGLVIVPLLWPAVLPVVNAAPRALLMVRKVELKPQPKHEMPRVSNDTTVRMPSAYRAETIATNMRPGTIARGPVADSAEGAPALAFMGSGMGSTGTGPFSGPAGTGGPVVVSATPKTTGPMHISSGVVAGMLLAPITPVYPQLARATHTSGTVVLRATIDQSGRITGLQVLSGPDMLRRAALDAVQVARYRPFLLNGQPTEVETTITVVFSMGT